MTSSAYWTVEIDAATGFLNIRMMALSYELEVALRDVRKQMAELTHIDMNLPEMKPVDSTKIKAIGYAPEERALYVTFKSDDSTYRYFDVSPEEYHDLEAAKSVGAQHTILARSKNMHVNRMSFLNGQWKMEK